MHLLKASMLKVGAGFLAADTTCAIHNDIFVFMLGKHILDDG